MRSAFRRCRRLAGLLAAKPAQRPAGRMRHFAIGRMGGGPQRSERFRGADPIRDSASAAAICSDSSSEASHLVSAGVAGRAAGPISPRASAAARFESMPASSFSSSASGSSGWPSIRHNANAIATRGAEFDAASALRSLGEAGFANGPSRPRAVTTASRTGCRRSSKPASNASRPCSPTSCPIPPKPWAARRRTDETPSRSSLQSLAVPPRAGGPIAPSARQAMHWI